jgi:acyl carrier protein
MEYSKNSLKQIFSSVLNITNEVNIETIKIGSPQKWDSINHIRIILEIQKKFKIKIPNSKFSELNSFNKIENYLKTI